MDVLSTGFAGAQPRRRPNNVTIMPPNFPGRRHAAVYSHTVYLAVCPTLLSKRSPAAKLGPRLRLRALSVHSCPILEGMRRGGGGVAPRLSRPVATTVSSKQFPQNTVTQLRQHPYIKEMRLDVARCSANSIKSNASLIRPGVFL